VPEPVLLSGVGVGLGEAAEDWLVALDEPVSGVRLVEVTV